MKRLIQAVQKVFWGLLGASAIVAAVGFPAGRDAALTDVEQELRRFTEVFDQASLERTLLEMAQVQGKTTVKEVVGLLEATALPEVTVSDPNAAVAPLAALELSTLGAVHRHSKPDSSLDIAAVDPKELATALSWRLARFGEDKPVEVESITLLRAKVSEAQAEREAQTHAAREKKLATLREHAAAAKKAEAADELYRARIKWKAHWKMISRANEKRQEAAAEEARLRKQLNEDSEAYQALSKQALSFKRGGDGDATPGLGVARVVLTAGGEKTTLDIPQRLRVRTVPVSPLSASSFPVTHDAGLWPELEGLSPRAALEALQGRFSWHRSTVGLLLLHALPVSLPVLLLLLVGRIRAVSNGYSPFNTDGRGGLPKVGLGQPVLDALIVTTLPAIAGGLCAWSLIGLGRVPTIPVLASLAAIGLGLSCFNSLRELRALTDAVVRSQSAPPPPGMLGER